jgi:hypothetical protein
MKVQLPKLSYSKSIGWYFSMVRDPSARNERVKAYWAKGQKEAQKLYKAGIARLVAEHVGRTSANPNYSPVKRPSQLFARFSSL